VNIMNATGWQSSGGITLGVRVGVANAKEHFDSSWSSIEVEIDGELFTFPLSKAFWRKCPEFRGAPVTAWMRRHGLAPWPRGQPPEVVLTPLGRNRFKLSLAP
jgi:hypothetical protein